MTDLSGEAWASELNNAALGVIKDSDDKLYALMTTGSCLGTAVNMNVCEAAGVDPWAIETWKILTQLVIKSKQLAIHR